MTIDQFAREHRLHVRLDECGDKIIPGTTGRRDGRQCDRQLYFDGSELCLMVLDGAPIIRSRWKALGGKLWLGEISPDATGKRVQDVKITGIPLANAKLAIQLARVKSKRIMSEAQRLAAEKALAKARAPKDSSKSPGQGIASA